MTDKAEVHYNRIIQILKDWSKRVQYTYERKSVLSPTQISTHGEIIITLSNEVTLIDEKKTVVKGESGPFKHNLYSDAAYEEKLHEFINAFDIKFYKEVEDKKNELNGNNGGFID